MRLQFRPNAEIASAESFVRQRRVAEVACCSSRNFWTLGFSSRVLILFSYSEDRVRRTIAPHYSQEELRHSSHYLDVAGIQLGPPHYRNGLNDTLQIFGDAKFLDAGVGHDKLNMSLPA